jgi:hypothetical protein
VGMADGYWEDSGLGLETFLRICFIFIAEDNLLTPVNRTKLRLLSWNPWHS